MVSAPATIPATSEPIFNPGLAPTLAATRTCRRARSSSPMFWASRTAGISPACDTRFGSSNLACVVAAVCNNRIPEVPFRSWRCELQQPAFSQVKGHFCCYDTLPRQSGRWIQAQDLLEKQIQHRSDKVAITQAIEGADHPGSAADRLIWTHVAVSSELSASG